MRHLLKPNRSNNELVIKTAVKPRGPNLPSKRPLGSIYEFAKFTAKQFGIYQEIKQYDPGYYIEKYTYKPRKRIAGYLGQKLHEKKQKSFKSPSRRLYQKQFHNCFWTNENFSRHDNCKGG